MNCHYEIMKYKYVILIFLKNLLILSDLKTKNVQKESSSNLLRQEDNLEFWTGMDWNNKRSGGTGTGVGMI